MMQGSGGMNEGAARTGTGGLRASVIHALGHLVLALLVMALVYQLTPPFFGGDLETARNYLTTVASTLATSLSLSISVIMVAIQFTASKYTHRVLDFFVRFPWNLSLLAFYLGTILHSVYLLTKIEDHPSDRPPHWIDQQMSAELVMLVGCLLSLIVYVYFIIQLLKPETIVKGIQREYVLAYRARDYEGALAKVEQICDIGKKSVSEMDTVTAVFCVENIAEMMHHAKLPSEQADDALWYHERIVGQLIGIASISFKERETLVSARILNELHEMGMRYAESGSLQAASVVIDAYALIVRNNLVGQQLQNMIQQAVEQIFSITCEVTKNRLLCKDTRQFVLQSFRNLGDIGKLVIKNEPYGHNFVARCIVSHAFGDLLTTLLQAKVCEEGQERLGLVKSLLHEYMRLAKRLMLKSEMIDIVQITTWLRKEMIPHHHETRRVYPHLYLFLLLTSTALYLRRPDIVVMLIRAIGKYFHPDMGLVEELARSRIDIRPFFDYHEPERYLMHVFELWQAYHAYTRRYPKGPEPLPVAGVLEQQEAWRDLFDGLDPAAFLGVPPHH